MQTMLTMKQLRSKITNEGNLEVSLSETELPDPEGNRLIVRDKDGRRTGTIDEGIGDRFILRDSTGRRIGTVEPRR